MARGVLAEGRLLDAARMIEPLIERADGQANGHADAGQLLLRCLSARVHLLRHGDSRTVYDLLGSYEESARRSQLDEVLRGEVALWLGWSRAWQDDERYDDARALNLLDEAERAFDVSMNPSGRCWTHIAKAHAYFTIDEYRLMLQSLSDAAALQDRLNDVGAKAWIDHLSVAGARFEGRYRDARLHADALARYGDDFNDGYAVGRGLAHRAVIDFELGKQPEEIIALARKAESMLRRSAVQPGYSLLSAYHAHIGALIRRGSWKEADRLISDALENIGYLGTAPAYITLHRARLREYRGQLQNALDLLDDISNRVDRHHRLLDASVSHVRGGVLLKMNRRVEAHEQASRELRNAREAGHVGYQVRALLQNVRVAVEDGDEDEARKLVREAEGYADYFSLLPLAAQRFLVLGRLSRLRDRRNEARAYYTQSLSAFSLMGDVYSGALVQCDLALLGTAPAEARNLAAAALRTFEELSAGPDAKFARKMLRSIPPESDDAVVEHEAAIGSVLARAAISVDLVAEAWLQAAEELAPGRWLVVYRYDDDDSWSRIHQHGDVPGDLVFPNPALDRVCEKGVDWMRLRGLPAPAFFFGMECGGEGDPACAAIEKRLEPWIPVVGLALEHAILRSSRLGAYGGDGGIPESAVDGVIYAGPGTRSVARQISFVKSGRSPVLITGESGVGKARAARAIHESGDRRSGPFVHFRCAMQPSEALERALFGSEADQSNALLSADGGTLYLEDIGQLPKEMQQRLLRFLEDGFLGGGSDGRARLDTRIIASSTRDLQQMVRDGAFQEDLYYRLRVVPIRIPPLRERREEIPLLVQHFIKELTAQKPTSASITTRALEALIRYDWPGNVRQLRNEIERLIAAAGPEPFTMIDVEDLSPAIRDAEISIDHTGSVQGICSDGKGLDDILAAAEKSVIEQILVRHRGQVSSSAEALGLSRQGLYKKMKRLGIEPADFQSETAESTTHGSS